MLVIVPRLYRRAGPVLLGLALAFQLPVDVILAFIQMWMSSQLGPLPDGVPRPSVADAQRLLTITGVYVLAAYAVGLLAVVAGAAFVRAGATTYLHGKASFRDAAVGALRHAPSLVGAAMLSGLAILAVVLAGVLAMLLVLAGLAGGTVVSEGGPAVFLALVIGVALAVAVVAISVRWSFFAPAIVVEAMGAVGSLGRSWRLTAGNIWRTFGVILMFALLVLLFQVLVTQLLALATDQVFGSGTFGSAVAAGIGVLVALPFAPIVPLAVTVLYFDLRVRQEGSDVAPVQSSPGVPPAPGGPAAPR